jgi:hypothetical protein
MFYTKGGRTTANEPLKVLPFAIKAAVTLIADATKRHYKPNRRAKRNWPVRGLSWAPSNARDWSLELEKPHKSAIN